MNAEDRWKAALAEIDPARKVNDPDRELGATPQVRMLDMKSDLQKLMAWTASSWLNHAGDDQACREFRGFYVWLSRIAEQLFYAMRDFDLNEIGRFYQEKGGE